MKQHCLALFRTYKKEKWTTPPLVDQVLPYAPLRLHTIDMIPQCVWLLCFWLATMNERFITIYFKKSNNTTKQKNNNTKTKLFYLHCKDLICLETGSRIAFK